MPRKYSSAFVSLPAFRLRAMMSNSAAIASTVWNLSQKMSTPSCPFSYIAARTRETCEVAEGRLRSKTNSSGKGAFNVCGFVSHHGILSLGGISDWGISLQPRRSSSFAMTTTSRWSPVAAFLQPDSAIATKAQATNIASINKKETFFRSIAGTRLISWVEDNISCISRTIA